MTRFFMVGAVVCASMAAVGCGQSSEQQQAAEKMAAGAQQAAAGAQAAGGEAQKGMEQMMQGLQQMAQAANTGGPVKLVEYDALKALMPEIKGWTRGEVKGEQVTMGISVSRAEARYEKDDQHMKLEIVDTSFSQMLLAPFMMFARAGYEQKSDDGYKKGVTLAGHPGFESWEKNGRDAEVHLLVANRFLVNAEASNVESVEPARTAVQAVDLGKLAGMK